MAQARVNLYEALFLINQQSIASDFAGCVDHVKEVLARAEAQVHVLGKWDERKLAYEIEGQKRGTFLLAYFHARSTQIANIERDCNLSDIVTRALIIKADHIGDAELEVIKRDLADVGIEGKLRSTAPAPAPAAAPAAPAAPANA
jgi:small subunit ribosomal protein S6